MTQTYIRSSGNISPQNTFEYNSFLSEIVENEERYMQCIEPNYKEYINPKLTRRMSRLIKMAICASKACLEEADIDVPGAIITGTGMGCLQDTIKFMNTLIDNDETFLNPASFIQSTHNTISGQIALLLNCKNYNSTYAHRGASFESALVDGMMLLEEDSAETVLVGGADEIIPESYAIMDRLGYFKKNDCCNKNLIQSKTEGSIAGEGAAYFLLSSKEDEANHAKIISAENFYKPESEKLDEVIKSFLDRSEINMNEIDIVLLGNNGDSRTDSIYLDLQKGLFENTNQAYFKHLCGEYHTASAFALWLASSAIKNQEIPDVIKATSFVNKPVNSILVYNHHKNLHHSLFLLAKC